MKKILNFIIKISPKPFARRFSILKLMVGLFILEESYLNSTGYINAFINKSLKDIHGENIPWMNYAMISFLNEKLNDEIILFEYGSGSSTKYFSKFVKRVVSVEYDEKWFNTIKKDLAKIVNATIFYHPLNADYPKSIEGSMGGDKYNLIVIDGRKRNECAEIAIKYLSENGVIIFDDSQREKYQSGIDFLINKGFSHLFFEGLAPGGISKERTSIFYKPGNNCLNI